MSDSQTTDKELFIQLVRRLKKKYKKLSAPHISERMGRKRGYITNLLSAGTGRVTKEEVKLLKAAFPELLTKDGKIDTRGDLEKENEKLRLTISVNALKKVAIEVIEALEKNKKAKKYRI